MARPEYVKWYKRASWLKLRKKKLALEPTCRMCRKDGDTKQATIVDHIKPHKGDVSLFFDFDNLQSLCKHHHDSHKQRMEKSGDFGCDERGFPSSWR